MDSSGLITVRIKHGSLKCGDLDIECNFTNKVRQLKQMICDQSPMHPEICDQRLIYAGHLLGDEQALKDVFTANGEVTQSSYTVHLAYSRDVLGRFNQQNNSSSQSSSSTQSTERTTPAPSASQPAANPEIRNFSMPYPGQQQYQHIQMGINPEFIALHEYYVRQMMAYMIHWSQVSLQMVHPTGTLHTNIPSRPFVIPQPVPEEPAPAPAAGNPRNIDAQENVRVNDVVNRGEDDEAPRDVLDWMYTLVRVALIFSVVYFYSNFTRFFLVVLFTALVMVFQRRQVAQQAEQVAANQRQANANAPPARPNPPANSQGPSAGAGNVGNSEDQSSPNQGKQDTSVPSEEEPARPDTTTGTDDVHVGGGSAAEPVNPNPNLAETFEQRRSIRDITWTFLTTFFTSLIPDMPQNN